MRVLMVLSMAAMMLSAADRPAAQKNAKPKAVPIAPKLVQIPADAVQIGPTSYRYTGPDGKTLLYVKTPFGITVAEEKPQPVPSEDHRFDSITATEDGDTVRFARPTPFGMIRWQKNKSELNEMEQAVWGRELARQVPPEAPAQVPAQVPATGQDSPQDY